MKNNYKKSILVFFPMLMILIGCSKAATINPTILFQTGDLPNNITAGKIEAAPAWIIKDLPDATNQLYNRVEKDGSFVGGIVLLQYSSNATLEEAYKAVINRMGDNRISNTDGSFTDPVKVFWKGAVTDIGEKSAFAVVWDPMGHDSGLYGGDIAFVRCNSLVIIRYDDAYPQDKVLNYLVLFAKNVDDRIVNGMCAK